MLGALAFLSAGCAAEQSAAGQSFVPERPHTLRVATAFLHAPGFWEGTPPASGFEADLARALAHRLGLEQVVLVHRSFAAIVAGKLGDADIALSQLTPTRSREHVLDFTSPYLEAPPGVLARTGVEAGDVKTLRELHWVVSSLSTLTPIVEERIRPTDAPIVVADRTQALAVLRSGKAEALLLDLPVALGLAHADPQRYHVIGQLDGDNALAAALPNGSANFEVVDSAIRALVADGTIDRLAKRWLGQSGSDVPLIRTEAS